MYYSFPLRKVYFDAIDYFLISAFITSLLTHKLYPHLMEEAELERLKVSIIKKSRLKIHFKKIKKKFKRKFKPLSVSKVLLQPRGGDLTSEYIFYEYKLAFKLRKFILKFLALLKTKELDTNSYQVFAKQFFYGQVRIIVQLLLEHYKIQIHYLLANKVDPELIAVAVLSGSATGIVSPWIPILRSVLAPTALVSTFALKTLITQSFKSVKSFSRWVDRRRISYLLKNEKIREELGDLLVESQHQFQKELQNSNKITIPDMPHLNWNRNPEIKKAAQRLKVFQKAPVIDQNLELDPVLKDLFKELGVGDRSTIRTKAKMVFYRDLVTDDGLEFLNDLEILESDVARIQIKN